MPPSETERIKLLAGAFDRVAVACITAGIIAPLAAAIYLPPEHPLQSWVYVVATAIWLSAAVALHLFARVILGGLDYD